MGSAGPPTTLDRAAARWVSVTPPDPGALTDARLQMHHAAQIAASVAISFLPAVADDSHTNLEWLDSFGVFATHVVPAHRPFRVALRPSDLSLLVVDGFGHGENGFALHGHTMDEAYGWLAPQLRAAGADPANLTTAKHYEIPHHPVATGRAFDASDSEAFLALARWWSNGDTLLRALAQSEPGTLPVRCWPHHFDLATSLLNDGGTSSIGAGLSPGDEWYDAPYLYVSPSPSPRGAHPVLAIGHWHADGWQGAVLEGNMLADTADAGTRAVQFLERAIDVCRGVAPPRAVLTVGRVNGTHEGRGRLIERDDEIDALLAKTHRVAVLGIKIASTGQPAYYVPEFVQRAGFEIIPVPVYFPEVTEILGERVYRRLADVPGQIDLVNIFRRPHKIPSHVDDILAARPRAVWMQLGIRNDDVAQQLIEAGIEVIQNRCMLIEIERGQTGR